jgi:hypothetical protein
VLIEKLPLPTADTKAEVIFNGRGRVEVKIL